MWCTLLSLTWSLGIGICILELGILRHNIINLHVAYVQLSLLIKEINPITELVDLTQAVYVFREQRSSREVTKHEITTRAQSEEDWPQVRLATDSWRADSLQMSISRKIDVKKMQFFRTVRTNVLFISRFTFIPKEHVPIDHVWFNSNWALSFLESQSNLYLSSIPIDLIQLHGHLMDPPRKLYFILKLQFGLILEYVWFLCYFKWMVLELNLCG